MAITRDMGLGGIFGGNIGAAQQSTMISNGGTTGYQNTSMWDQERAYREEMIRQEERKRLEHMYREQIQEMQRYGYAVPDAPLKKSPTKSANSFPEGYEKNLLLLLEN